ncbi:MAG: SufD family Fe-S cluster assembly protein, partial [Planctomycetia bacterium]|nr:SufD family Fe-S cluster assembly protein [Planctomycetia bacterium]
MTAVLEDKDIYLSSFASFEKQQASDPRWLAQLRQSAIDRFAAVGFPTLDDEEWRSTPLSALTRIPFQRAHGAPQEPPTETTLGHTLTGKDWTQLLFVNGRFVRLLPTTAELATGASVGNLAQALRSEPAALKDHLGRHADIEDNAFIALNTAFLADGAVIRLPKQCVNRQPIHLIFLALPDAEPTVSHPRNLLVLEAHSQATVIESYLSAGAGASFTNSVTEVVLGEGAHL